MKTASEITSTDTRAAVRGRPKVKSSEEFVSLADTRALMTGSAAFRQRRLEAGDMVSTDEAASLSGTSRVTVNAWIAKGRAIGLTQMKRGYRMPRWQFDPAVWDVLPKLSKALATSEGWALLAFLETPNGGLDGATPRAEIERGNGDRVVELAARDS